MRPPYNPKQAVGLSIALTASALRVVVWLNLEHTPRTISRGFILVTAIGIVLVGYGLVEQARTKNSTDG